MCTHSARWTPHNIQYEQSMTEQTNAHEQTISQIEKNYRDLTVTHSKEENKITKRT